MIGGDPTDWPIGSSEPPAPDPQPVVKNMQFGRRGFFPLCGEPGKTAFLDAASRIRMQIYRDALVYPEELRNLFFSVAFDLGERGLSAARVRRFSRIDDPNALRRFRRKVGISLTEYIRKRQHQLAAKMYYRSGLPAADVARILEYDDEEALERAVMACKTDAFLDNAAKMRDWINRDAQRKPPELEPLLSQVAWEIDRPGISATSVRRAAQKFQGVDDPHILRRFRRQVGFPLTEYIRRRRSELAARIAYTSDIPVDDIAEYLGFASGKALTWDVEWWAQCSLEELRDGWEDRGIDKVVWERVWGSEAAEDDMKQFLYEAARLNPGLIEAMRKYAAEKAAS